MALSELCVIGTGSRNTNEAVEGGMYPFYVRSQEPLRIDSYGFDETAIITAGDGVGVGKVFHYVEGKYSLHQRAYRLVPDESRINPKFLFHYVRSYFPGYLKKVSVHASVTSLRKPMFEKFVVPVPDMKIQEQTVSILDRFERLTSDISIGLPVELQARRKQYEYYRDKLLTFKERV